MKVGFFKGSLPFPKNIFEAGVRFWTRGVYSHVVLGLSQNADGTWHCGSSVGTLGGVCYQDVNLNDSSLWDCIDIDADVQAADAWFTDNLGKPYDYLGLLGFLIRPVTDGDRSKFFCSEAVALALGYTDGWRFDPNTFYPVVLRHPPQGAK